MVGCTASKKASLAPLTHYTTGHSTCLQLAPGGCCAHSFTTLQGSTAVTRCHAAVPVCRRVWDSGLTCAFLSSFIFAFSSLFVKLTDGRVPVLEVCLVRSSISAALSLALMHFSGMPWRLFYGKKKNLKILFLRGCCGACSMVSTTSV